MSIDIIVAVHGVLERRVVEQGNKDEFSGRLENMPKRALVVDNDFFFVEFLSELLEARGYHVIKAYDGKEAISQLEQEAVEVMFVDMVMPKIDGKELIRYSRSRFPDGSFPIIALSGVIVQQLAKLDEIGADYFIVKGPMEKMANHIVGLMDKIEKQHIPAASNETVFQPRDLISRQISDEFAQSPSFHRCITESAGVGIAVIDRDTRVITANAMALDIINRTHEEVLNHRITTVFPDEKRETVIGSLNKIVLKPELIKTSFFVTMNSRKIRIIVSLLRIDGEIAGWIIVMEDT